MNDLNVKEIEELFVGKVFNGKRVNGVSIENDAIVFFVELLPLHKIVSIGSFEEVSDSYNKIFSILMRKEDWLNLLLSLDALSTDVEKCDFVNSYIVEFSDNCHNVFQGSVFAEIMLIKNILTGSLSIDKDIAVDVIVENNHTFYDDIFSLMLGNAISYADTLAESYLNEFENDDSGKSFNNFVDDLILYCDDNLLLKTLNNL